MVALVDVARHFLSKVCGIANSPFLIDHTGNRITTSVRGSDNGRPFVIGDVAQTEQDAVLFQDMPHRDAERRPGKLDEGEHGVYMTEADEEVQDRRGSGNELAIRVSVAGRPQACPYSIRLCDFRNTEAPKS